MAEGMKQLGAALAALPEVRELLLSLDAGTSPIAVSGLSGVHRAQLAAALRQQLDCPLLVLCADENEANRMALDLTALLGEEVSLLFAREWQLRDCVSASHGWEQQRIGTLCRLAAGEASVLVATVDALMQRTLPPDALTAVVEKAQAAALERRIDLPESLPAPVRQGQQVGTLTLCSGDTEVLTVPILAAESVPGRSWGRMFTDLLKQAVFLA